jgi:DNA-binding transcriptional LysR family regulator
MRTESRIDLRDAADWNWILPPSETHYGAAMRTVCRQHGFEPATSHEIIDTAVTLTLAAKGLGVAPVTDMMIGLNSSVPIIRIALVQEIVRKIVLIRPAGADARPTVRAVTEIVQDVISDHR